ncbi:hypothetical protein GIB67_026479 [Kingdonia uniflora]|uniref:Fungal lipase-type domain-containing protein n=1 Tax=Kingdonia uniflora TaxID=39325 RepID=A0A7J7P6D3_9MAGN|nr:hypothetical protein GIB67_026479 [Kingdonia uniflora]
MRGAIEEGSGYKYLIVRPEKSNIMDLYRFYKSDGAPCFIETDDGDVVDHRWVIVVSIVVRKIIAVLGKPMEWVGYVVEFLLNLLSENGDFLGLIYNLLTGKAVMPRRDSTTFITAIGHLDGRIDLYKGDAMRKIREKIAKSGENDIQIGDKVLMDFCIIASKLAYENAKVIKNIVDHHWKMHFVDFFNCWNDFQKERSTQVFILCDKPKDANLILISFRGTEPFDADDWSTDFDYSWYEIPKLGKIHMGFLEALGLGNRAEASTFQNHLQVGGYSSKGILHNGHGITKHTLEGTGSTSRSYSEDKGHSSDIEEDSEEKKEFLPELVEMTAYYAVRSKLKILLKEHKNAKFIVTGHSLGGALAILFPTVLVLHKEKEIIKRLLGVYTFGQPRVGNRQLGRFMQSHLEHPSPKYFRVVYCNDLVPRLPYDNKTFLYKHFGYCLYYDSNYIEQEVDEEPNKNYFGLWYLIPEYINAGWELIRGITMGYTHGEEYKEGWFRICVRVMGLVLPGISAHCPTDYINSVRLGREEDDMPSSSI